MSANEAKTKPFIASMGIYVFKKDLLVKLLKEKYTKSNDFGGEIIPAAASDHKVVAYLFNDYWEDIGTIKSFFEANLALAQQVSRMQLPNYPLRGTTSKLRLHARFNTSSCLLKMERVCLRTMQSQALQPSAACADAP